MAAKDPGARYPDYDSLIEDIRRVKSGYAPALKVLPTWRFLNRKLAIAAGIVLVLSATTLALWSRSKRVASSTTSKSPAAEITQRGFDDPERGGRFRPDDLGPPPDGEFDERPGPPSRGREGRFPFPLPRLPRPDFTPLEEGPVDSMLAQADQYAQKNPQNFRDLIDRYRQVLDKTRGTPKAEAVDRKLNEAVSRHQAAQRQAIKSYESKMDEKLRAGKPQEAYNVWKDFPANLRTRESDQQIEQLLERALPAGFSPK
jgi:hypothetical protein